jgi:hypothetical protein
MIDDGATRPTWTHQVLANLEHETIEMMDSSPKTNATDRPDPRALALDALAAGDDPRRAADLAGIDEEALRDWLDDDPEFLAELNRARRDRADRLRTEVRSLAADAVATLRALVTGPEVPPAVRLRAALTVLGTVGAMAEETIGPTTTVGVRAEQSRRHLLESLGR